MGIIWKPNHTSYRLPTKTLVDSDADKIDFSNPKRTTITEALAWPLPAVWPVNNRLSPWEATLWQIGHGKSRVVLRAIAVESDGDLKGYIHDLRFPVTPLIGAQQAHKADNWIHDNGQVAQNLRGTYQNAGDEELLAYYDSYSDVANIYKSINDLVKARLIEQETARRNSLRSTSELHFEIPAIPNIDPSGKYFELLSTIRKNAESTWYPEGVPTQLGGKTINQLIQFEGIAFADGIHLPGWWELPHPVTGFKVLGAIPKGGA